MSEKPASRILVIGAGCVGVITGYHLSLAGADVTFLVRPHRAEELKRPQVLYCYEGNELKDYQNYKYITDPSQMIGDKYDYILVALDGATLRNETGHELARTIGDAARQTNAKVILASIFVDLRTWFLEVAGIPGEQVTNGHLDIHVYPPKRLTLPSQAPVDPELIAKADFAYSDKLEDSFSVDDNSPAVATGFAEIYNACGVSRCAVKPAAEYAVGINPMLPIFPACELLDWPKFKDIGNKGEVWSLAVAAVKEIQGLSIHGELGQKASTETTETGLAAALAAWEQHMIPLDLQEFNRFHHAVKLQSQGREHLRVCLSYGEAEGKPMSALKELLRRVDRVMELYRGKLQN